MKLQVFPEDPDVGLAPPREHILIADFVLLIILVDLLLQLGDIIPDDVKLLEVLQHLGGAETDGVQINKNRPLDAPPFRLFHPFPVDERLRYQRIGGDGGDGTVPVLHLDGGEGEVDDGSVGTVRGHLHPIADFHHLIGRQLNRSYKTKDRVLKHEQQHGRHGAQSGNQHRGILTQQ